MISRCDTWNRAGPRELWSRTWCLNRFCGFSQEAYSVSVKLTTRQVGDVTVVDVAGRITLGEGSSALRDAVRDMVSKNQKKILLNLGDVSYIDSSGIGELVSRFTTATRAGSSSN